MRAATSVALIALLASPAFAAPLSTPKPVVVEETPTLGSQVISSAAGGAASALVGNLLSKLEGLFSRDFDERSAGALTNIVQQAQTLSPADKATVKNALMNKIGTLQAKRDDSELEARAPLSANGLGGSIISSAAGGAASGLVGNLLGLIEGLFRRDFTDVHDEDLYVKRDVSSVSTIIQQAQTLSPTDKAAVKTALMNKIGSLAPGHAKRLSASGAAGTALGGLASVGANGLVSGILEKIESLFGRDDLGLEARAPLSANGLGGSIISSAAGGAASGLVGNLLGLIEGLFRRDFTDEHDEAMYMKRDVNSISNIIKQAQTLSASDKATVKTALMNKIGALQTPSKRLSASGAAGTALGGLASVGANGLVSGILEKIESLFRRDDLELEARAPLSANGLGGSIISSAAGGAASGLVGNLLGLIEGLFRRDLADAHDEAAYVKRDVNSISTIIQQAQTLSASDKAAVKTALMNKIGSLQSPSKRLSASGAAGTALGGLASVGANSLVSGLLEKLESLFRRDEEEALMAREELHGMERRSPLSASSFKPSGNGVTSQVLGGLAGGAASGLVGNLLSEFESLFQRSEEFSINDLD